MIVVFFGSMQDRVGVGKMAMNLHVSSYAEGGSRTAPTGSLYNIALVCLGSSMGNVADSFVNETLQFALWDYVGNFVGVVREPPASRLVE